MNLMEAFKALDQLNEDVFSVDAEGIKKLNDFMQNDDSVDELSVFDIDSTEDDVIRDDEKCNEGDMILDCCVCHSKVFKPISEVVVDEESQIANAGEECPYCFSVEGYKIVGQVKASGEEEGSVDEEVSESDEDSIQGESDVAEEVLDVPFSDLDSDEEDEVQESVKDRIINCRMKDKRIDESIDLLTKDNTIASLLRDNMDKLSSITDVNELQDAIMDLVNESDIANKPAALKLKRDLYSKKSVGALLSTIGTYMTGEKVIKIGRNSKKSRKESFKHRRTIKESEDSDFQSAKDMWEMEDPNFDFEEYVDEFYFRAVDELSKKYKDLDVEPSIQSGMGAVFASYTRNDGKKMKASWDYEYERESLEGAFMDATSSKDFFTAVKSFIEKRLKNASEIEESFVKSKRRKSRKESFKHRRITESKIPSPYDKYFVITDEDDELVGTTVSGVNLIAALEPKDPDAIDTYGYLTTDPDFPVVEIVRDRAYPVDLEELSESFKHRRTIKENVDTIKITSDDITISMDSDNDEAESIEGTKDNFIVEPVSDEAKEQIDFNSIDRESAEDAIEESLKESFGNIKFFRCSNIVPRNNRFILEGVIGFNSGRKRNTNFVFKPRKITESKVIFKGYSKELKESVKSMSLVCRNRGKKCIAESLKVSK